MLVQNSESLLVALRYVQTEKFWELSYRVYSQFLIKFLNLPYDVFLWDIMVVSVSESWMNFPAFEDIFILAEHPDN